MATASRWVDEFTLKSQFRGAFGKLSFDGWMRKPSIRVGKWGYFA